MKQSNTNKFYDILEQNPFLKEKWEEVFINQPIEKLDCFERFKTLDNQLLRENYLILKLSPLSEVAGVDWILTYLKHNKIL